MVLKFKHFPAMLENCINNIMLLHKPD